ncbi:hypothetical protein JCM10449v2_001424 [Rhodotorula kratochvilovae]
MEPVEHASDVWPKGQEYLRPIVATLYLLVVALLTVLLTRRWGSWSYLRRLPLIQVLVIVLLAASLAFVFISAVIVLGVGSSYSEAACNGGIWLCILLYASSKAVLYYLLLEKLQRVHSHSTMGRTGRFSSWWYRGGLVFFVAWLGVAGVMIAGRISLIRQNDGACIIGLRLFATVPMLAVDALTNIYLTIGFVLPVWRSKNEKARRLAKVSSIAAIAALVTSFANILVLSLQHGHQLSFVCLGSCGLDVAFNSVIVYMVTTARHSRDERSTTIGSMDKHAVELSAAGGGGKSGLRGARSGSYYPGSHGGVAFGTASGGAGAIGVHIVEEVRVEEDLEDSPPMASTRGFGGRERMPPMHTVSFQTPGEAGSLDDIDEEKGIEKV